MVQIDPLLAYGFASTLALVTQHRAAADEATEDELVAGHERHFSWTCLWLGLTFAPQAVYLMWRFPAWETMYAFPDAAAIPPALAAAVPISIVALGALGYAATMRLLRGGRRSLALALSALSFALPLMVATVGWDGTGYQRMLYAGAEGAWSPAVEISLGTFLTSEIALSLLWLEAILLVPFAIMLIRWSGILEARRRATGLVAADGASS